MSNKNYPGNESFTITLTDLWYFSMRLTNLHHLRAHRHCRSLRNKIVVITNKESNM